MVIEIDSVDKWNASSVFCVHRARKLRCAAAAAAALDVRELCTTVYIINQLHSSFNYSTAHIRVTQVRLRQPLRITPSLLPLSIPREPSI